MLAATSQRSIRTTQQHVQRVWISLHQGMNLERPQNTFRERGLTNSVCQGVRRRVGSGTCFPEAPKTPLTQSGMVGLESPAEPKGAHSAFIMADSSGSQWRVSKQLGGWSESWTLIKLSSKKLIQQNVCSLGICPLDLLVSLQVQKCEPRAVLQKPKLSWPLH